MAVVEWLKQDCAESSIFRSHITLFVNNVCLSYLKWSQCIILSNHC